MPTDITDERLIAESKKADTRAFDMLVMRYQGRLLGLLKKYSADSNEIEDIVQEAFLKAYRAIGSFRGDSSFYTWLCRIAINLAKTHFASKSRRLELIPKESFEDNDLSYQEETDIAENFIYSDELLAVIQATISNMSQELSISLTLRELEGLSYDEISTMMGCPIGTVRSRIFRAREILDIKIKEYME